MNAGATVQVFVRSYGQHSIHAADVPMANIRVARYGGTDITTVKAPVVARCGLVLRGRLVVMAGGITASRCITCRTASAAGGA